MIRLEPFTSPTSFTVSRFDHLLEAVQELQQGGASRAEEILRGVLASSSVQESHGLKTAIFANSLLKRVTQDAAQTENLYLESFDFKQIDLFNLMGTRMPMVTLATEIANRILAMHLQQTPILVDIGIGTGRQELALLRSMKEQGILPKKLTIVGVEPAAEALKMADEGISRLATELQSQIEFVPIHATTEDLSDQDWQSLRARFPRPVINSAFSLHHIKGRKNEVLAKLREWNPVVLLLSEPHSDHESADLEERFRNAWHHFGLVFDLIDELEMSAQEKTALKLFFFAREIEDILGSEEETRSERHETAWMWLDRLREQGFCPISLPTYIPDTKSHPVQLAAQGTHLSLRFRGQPVVSILAGRSSI
jgi:hypothetical protein